jgi:STE24 endopeptidase
VPLAIFVVVLLMFVLSPVQNAFSRRHEAEADWVALQTTRDPGAAQRLFQRFTKIALSDPRSPTWAYLLCDDHPTGMQRIEMAEAWRARYGGRH